MWVAFTCLFVHVIVHPVLVTLYLVVSTIVLFCSCLTIVSCIHSPANYFWSATVDSVGIKGIFVRLSISSFNWNCLIIGTVGLISSLSYSICG